MALGPIQMFAIRFPGSQFSGEIVPALAELVDSGTIRINDVLFVQKDEDGAVEVTELSELDDETYAVFDAVVADVGGLMNEDDARQLSGLLEPGTSAAVLTVEHVWASRFADAVRDSRGELVFSEFIPRAAIEVMEETAGRGA